MEFDLRTSLKGALYAPDPSVVTKYSGGYMLGNWAGFDFETTRNAVVWERGTAYLWLNPFTLSTTLHYKIQALGDNGFGGYREQEGLRFKWNYDPCPTNQWRK